MATVYGSRVNEIPDNTPEYSVSEIAGALKRTVETAFGQVRVRGELSGFRRQSSGHWYGSLKDERALIDLAMWRGPAANLSFRPEDGLEVIVTGKLTTYPGRSKYQLIVESMEPAGVGALLALMLTGQDLSIIALIGIVLLMGIVKKNSILLVEFTNHVRGEGKSIREALMTACPDSGHSALFSCPPPLAPPRPCGWPRPGRPASACPTGFRSAPRIGRC